MSVTVQEKLIKLNIIFSLFFFFPHKIMGFFLRWNLLQFFSKRLKLMSKLHFCLFLSHRTQKKRTIHIGLYYSLFFFILFMPFIMPFPISKANFFTYSKATRNRITSATHFQKIVRTCISY